MDMRKAPAYLGGLKAVFGYANGEPAMQLTAGQGRGLTDGRLPVPFTLTAHPNEQREQFERRAQKRLRWWQSIHELPVMSNGSPILGTTSIVRLKDIRVQAVVVVDHYTYNNCISPESRVGYYFQHDGVWYFQSETLSTTLIRPELIEQVQAAMVSPPAGYEWTGHLLSNGRRLPAAVRHMVKATAGRAFPSYVVRTTLDGNDYIVQIRGFGSGLIERTNQ